MANIAAKYKEELEDIKKCIETSYLVDKHNYDRFNDFRRFVFNTSLNENDVSILNEVGKPSLQFNILEAYISRLRGEFVSQEPSCNTTMADGVDDIDLQTINVVDGHIRSLIDPSNNDNLLYKIYTDILSGGFSVVKVYIDYVNERSFEQCIKIRRAYDPTLCGFDPLARESHKGDGEYSFELYPMRKEDIERRFGKEVSDSMTYSRNVEGFSWSYQNNNEKIALIADFYKKKRKKQKIVRVVDHGTMTMDEYKKLCEDWEADPTKIEQVPAIIGKPRITEFTTICRYVLLEKQIVQYEETSYPELPHVFIDGNSIETKTYDSTTTTRMTRPYVYHAKGIQQLKNFAGQTLAAWMENMVMHKWIAAVESIPENYQQAYIDPQKANVLLYNAFKRDDPAVPLPPPREVSVAPVPPEVTNTFDVTDKMTQVILGSYDSALGINDNQLSGTAIKQGALQSNMSAIPYETGCINGLNQIFKICVELFPKIYVTPRTIPVIMQDGKKGYVRINDKNGVKLDYGPNALQVKIKAGPSFAIQKNEALMQVESLMKASPAFADFINKKGVGFLLSNLEIRGQEQLMVMYAEYEKEQMAMQQQMQQMQQQMAIQNSPYALKQLDLQAKQQSEQLNAQLESTKMAISKQQADTDLLATLSKIGEAKDEAMVKRDKASAEEYRASVDLALKQAQMKHDHAMHLLEHHHEMNKEANNDKIKNSKTQEDS